MLKKGGYSRFRPALKIPQYNPQGEWPRPRDPHSVINSSRLPCFPLTQRGPLPSTQNLSEEIKVSTTVTKSLLKYLPAWRGAEGAWHQVFACLRGCFKGARAWGVGGPRCSTEGAGGSSQLSAVPRTAAAAAWAPVVSYPKMGWKSEQTSSQVLGREWGGGWEMNNHLQPHEAGAQVTMDACIEYAVRSPERDLPEASGIPPPPIKTEQSWGCTRGQT